MLKKIVIYLLAPCVILSATHAAQVNIPYQNKTDTYVYKVWPKSNLGAQPYWCIDQNERPALTTKKLHDYFAGIDGTNTDAQNQTPSSDPQTSCGASSADSQAASQEVVDTRYRTDSDWQDWLEWLEWQKWQIRSSLRKSDPQTTEVRKDLSEALKISDTGADQQGCKSFDEIKRQNAQRYQKWYDKKKAYESQQLKDEDSQIFTKWAGWRQKKQQVNENSEIDPALGTWLKQEKDREWGYWCNWRRALENMTDTNQTRLTQIRLFAKNVSSGQESDQKGNDRKTWDDWMAEGIAPQSPGSRELDPDLRSEVLQAWKDWRTLMITQKRRNQQKQQNASGQSIELNLSGGAKGLGKNILKELGRMLLAQIPAGGQNSAMSHNIPENKDPEYTTRYASYIHENCDELKKHMLEHGHLGYFPGLSYIPGRSPSVVNQLSSRGIFNIPFSVAKRVTSFQKNMLRGFLTNQYNYFTLPGGYSVTEDTFHLLPVITSELGFGIDTGKTDRPNLESVADGLIDNLLSTDEIKEIKVNPVQDDRFTIVVTYKKEVADNLVAQNILEGNAFGDNFLAYNLRAGETNSVMFVVEVDQGQVRIVTMYPI